MMSRLLLFFCVFGVSFCGYAQDTISLAGEWSVRLDSQKVERKIHLPGTLDDAGIGTPTSLTADKLDKQVLLHLTRKHSYIGYAWYSREVTIPQRFASKDIELVLERVLWSSKVWIDGREAGNCESLSVPHRYDLRTLLTPGRHRIMIRIDNSRQYDLSVQNMAHAYTNETQIIWNGILGRMEFIAHPRVVRITSLAVYPALADKKLTVRAFFQAPAGHGTLIADVYDGHVLVATRRVSVTLAGGDTMQDIVVPVAGCKAWDEFHPQMYTASLRLLCGGSKDHAWTTFGLREISRHDGLLWINGRRLFLRGTLECDIFPLTGHPPMDRKGWRKVFLTAKAYGLNHLRFHSWCPPEAAFEVADSLGMYLQVELPFWNMNAGKDTALNMFLEAEAGRISREYGNHPSFCLWSMGNELEGDFSWLAGMVAKLRKADPRHLYTSTTFTFQQGHGKWPEPGDDYLVTQYTKKGWVRGQGIFNTYPPSFSTDYTKAIDSIPVPIIIHEMGQYSVYPHLAEISKYTGVLDPLNFKAIRNDLQRKGLLQLAPAFTLASGKLAALLYKEEIERALKTKGMSGFDLLDLHDFPGQGTALVGVLDAFWDSKGLVTPAEHRMYCSAVVPLIRYEKAVYDNDETFSASVEVANFGDHVLREAVAVWALKNATGGVIASGQLPAADIAIGNGHVLGSLSVDLASVRKASCVGIEVRLAGTAYRNQWKIWVYPAVSRAAGSGGVAALGTPSVGASRSGGAGAVGALGVGGAVPVSTWGAVPAGAWGAGEPVFDTTVDDALRDLGRGHLVLLNPDTTVINGVAGRFAPVFWSPVHFPDQPGTMGLLCDPNHPALARFPTEAYSDWQWWDLVTSSKTMILDSLPRLEPIVRVIDNFFKNRRMADVIEASVGNGKLILVSMDITHALDRRPAARQLRYSLLEYMRSRAFHPAVRLTEEELRRLVRPSHPGGPMAEISGTPK